MAFAIVFDDWFEYRRILKFIGYFRAVVSRIMEFGLKQPEVQDKLIFCTKIELLFESRLHRVKHKVSSHIQVT